MLALLIGLLVACNAAFCGLYVCIRPHAALDFPASIYNDVADMYSLPDGPR